jgi:hypothetical protein
MQGDEYECYRCERNFVNEMIKMQQETDNYQSNINKNWYKIRKERGTLSKKKKKSLTDKIELLN